MSKNGQPEKLVPRLRFPEFQQDAPWRLEPVSSLARVTQGGTPSTSNDKYWDGSINWMTPAEMGKGDGPYIHETVRTITNAGLENCSSELLPAHSVVLSTRAPIGHLAINATPVAINQGCKGLVPLGDNSTRFIYYALLNRKHDLADRGAGNTFKELSSTALKTFELATTETAEQHKIAECLGSLDDWIAAETDALTALRRHKTGLMQQLFPRPGETRPRLRFPEFRDAGKWSEKTLGKLCHVLNNRRVPVTTADRVPGPFPYYGASGVVDYVNDYIFDERLVLVGEDGAKWEALQPTAFIAEGKYWVNNHAHVLKPHAVVDELLVAYLTLMDVGGFVTGAAPPKLTLAGLKKIPIPIPPSEAEQRLIADCLASLDTHILSQSGKIDALRDHKRGLMQQLFPAPDQSQQATP